MLPVQKTPHPDISAHIVTEDGSALSLLLLLGFLNFSVII